MLEKKSFGLKTPLECETFYLSLILNICFYISIIYNVLIIWYSSATTFIGSSWVLAIFSTVSSFILVYGLPFVFKFNANHILGHLYLLTLGLITLISTLFIIQSPSWVFIIIILSALVIFNITCTLSPYFQGLTKLKSLPLKIKYKNLFFSIVKFGSLVIAFGLCVAIFDSFPPELHYVCFYILSVSLLFVAFAHFLSFF